MSDLKHTCHECGGHVAYPQEAFGTTVHCPHCGRQTTLGEIYPEAPSAVSYRPAGGVSPPAPQLSEYFVNHEGTQYGPYTLEAIRSSLETGFLNSNDLGWCEGMQDWKPLNTIEGLIEKKNTGRPPPPPRKLIQPKISHRQVSSQGYGFAYSIVLLTLFIVDVAVCSAGNNSGVPWGAYVVGYGLIHYVESKSMEDPSLLPSGWWMLFVPAYLYRRARALRQPLTSFWVFSLLLCSMIGLAVADSLKSEAADASQPVPSQPDVTPPPVTPPSMSADESRLVAEAIQADELIQQIESTQDAVSKSWNRGIRDEIGGAAQLAMIRDQIVPVVRETKMRVEQFAPRSPKLQPVKAAMLELVQAEFSAWIAVNNAAAANNWPLARGLFDRMQIDRGVRERMLEAAMQTAIGK